MPKTNQVDINNQGLTDEQYEELEDLEKKSKKRGRDKQPLTEEEKQRLAELKKKRRTARLPSPFFGVSPSVCRCLSTVQSYKMNHKR